MKKVLFIAIFAVLAVAANAQKSMTASNGLARDTVSNTGVESWSADVFGYQKTVSIQVVVTKISGTVGGTMLLKVSHDGTNYFTLPGADTVTAANASGSYGWAVTDSAWPYYRVEWTGTGSMSASAVATVVARKN